MEIRFSRLIIIAAIITIANSLTGCLFETINQPSSAQPGEVITVNLKITDNIIPETNPHKGILGVIVPSDWEFISGIYNSSIGNGILNVSPQWQDSIAKYYPSADFGLNMKWIGLISDSGYTYSNITSFYVTLKLKVGQTQGCFNLGYLTSKATGGLLGTGNASWAPLSYPHPIGIPDSGLCTSIYHSRPAPEWDNMLDRKSGWTGSDGIYSIPLDGLEKPLNAPADSQIFVFSDTFIGDVDSNNHRYNTKMVNNTLAMLPSDIPDTSLIKFFWAKDSTGTPKTIFVPNTLNARSGDWYWLMDGIALNENIYVYALRLNPSTGLGFEVNGVALLKFNIDPVKFIKNIQQFDTPLFLKDTVANWDIVLGQAIMPMTNVSGNPNPDGYIYVYGPKSSSNGKELMASRVLPQNIENFSQYQYWNGTTWGNSISQMAPLTSGISQEFSVTPIKNNKFLVVYQAGNSVYVRRGDSPIGPFGMFYNVYDCPEVLNDPNIFVYNAKAHPNLSDEQELLISYNVNTYDFAGHFSNADIYRPRFIYLTINDSITSVHSEAGHLLLDYNLFQNYPNPFNPSTQISFAIPNARKVSVKVFNLLGELVSELADRYYESGRHELVFNANSFMSSGIYFCRMESDNFIKTIKMMYLK